MRDGHSAQRADAIYVRFVCSQPHPTIDAELGMFAVRDEIDFSLLRGSLQKAHEEAFYWFSAKGCGGLLYPRLGGKLRTYKVRKSLFWFDEQAYFWGHPKGSVVRRARDLARVITDAGIEIREIRVEEPGEIIWQDSKQVLAFPGRSEIPRAF